MSPSFPLLSPPCCYSGCLPVSLSLPLPSPPCAVPSRPCTAAPAPETLGALGQPIRRINTFTASLPSFEEGEEKMGGGHGGGVDLSGVGPAPDAGDDLASHLLGAAPPMSSLDDAMHMLDGL